MTTLKEVNQNLSLTGDGVGLLLWPAHFSMVYLCLCLAMCTFRYDSYLIHKVGQLSYPREACNVIGSLCKQQQYGNI
jgi:hypothetical protein